MSKRTDQLAGRSVLFVVRSFSGTGAQPIRFQEIISHLREDYEIHVLELTHGDAGVREENGVTIHSLPYSRIGRIVNPPVRSSSGAQGGSGLSGSIINPQDRNASANLGGHTSETLSGRTSTAQARNASATLRGHTSTAQGRNYSAAPGVSASGSRRLAVLKRHIRSLFFPDSVVTEGSRLRREAVRLTRQHGFRVVVLSAFPFTVLRCAKALKRFPRTRVILDVGDPFYRNSRNGFLRDLMARSFEARHLRFIDSLVVTNEMTRNHYIDTFSHPGPESVHIVPMGISESMASGFRAEQMQNSSSVPADRFSLVYAGQLYWQMREPFGLYSAVKQLNSEAGVKVELQMYGSFSREFSSGYEEAGMISFMGQIPHHAIKEVYRDAGAVVFIDNAYGMQTPGKVFEVALTERPVLFITDRDDSPASEVIRGLEHIIVTVNKSDSIAAAIRKIMVMKPGYPSRELVRTFLWENRARQYSQIINQLAGE